MHLFHGLNFYKIDIGLIVIEAIVIFSLIVLLIRIWKGRYINDHKKEILNIDSLLKWIKEGETICERFLRVIPSKEIQNDRLSPPISYNKRFTHPKGFEAQILKMAEAGYHISEISQSLGLSPGEIRFALDLIKYKKSLAGMLRREST